MQIPKIDKVVINVGAGEAKDNSKVIDAIMNDLALITGQKPVVCRAKKSVANFKIREGMPIGVKVTLRGEKVKCKACHSGYFIPFNTTADKAHSFYCSNPKCNFIVRIDPVIEVE